jgi:hypothetical protein
LRKYHHLKPLWVSPHPKKKKKKKREMEKMSQNLQKNRPLKISRKHSRELEHEVSDSTSTKIILKRNRYNQAYTDNTAGCVIFEVGLLAVPPPQQVPISGATPTQCFYCHKSIKKGDIFIYRYIFLHVILFS